MKQRITPNIRRLVREPPLIMTDAMRCACCHIVRGCRGCCRTCKQRGTACTMWHECEIENDRHFGEDGTDWWISCTRYIKDFVWDAVPDNIMDKLNKQK